MADLSLDFSTPLSNSYQDFLVVDGDLVMTDDLEVGGTDPVLQDIIQTLRWIAGEWFLDIQSGTPWFQDIFVKNPDLDGINAVMMNTIKNVPGVVAITRFVMSPSNASRSFSLNFSAQKTTGTVSYDGIIDF